MTMRAMVPKRLDCIADDTLIAHTHCARNRWPLHAPRAHVPRTVGCGAAGGLAKLGRRRSPREERALNRLPWVAHQDFVDADARGL